jgi:hypothetical protein
MDRAVESVVLLSPYVKGETSFAISDFAMAIHGATVPQGDIVRNRLQITRT